MRRDGSLSWQTIVVDVAVVNTKTRALALYMAEWTGRGFVVLAAETDIRAQNEHDFFNDHKHATVGEAKTRAEGEKLASAYAKKWLKARQTEERCACEEIRVTARQIERKSA